MSEKPKDKIIDLTERRRQKDNESKRIVLKTTPDGNILYPEERVELTTRDTLTMAKNIVQQHSFDSEQERMRKGIINFGLDRVQLASQRGFAQASPSQSLFNILSFHHKNPGHYAKELLLATAEELVRRLSPQANAKKD